MIIHRNSNSISDSAEKFWRWNGVSADGCIAGSTFSWTLSICVWLLCKRIMKLWVCDWFVLEIELDFWRDAVCGVHSAHRTCWSFGFQLSWLLRFPFSGEEETVFYYLRQHSRPLQGLSVFVFFFSFIFSCLLFILMRKWRLKFLICVCGSYC